MQHLGPSKGQHGSAEYRMLIAHGRAEAIRPNTETTLPNAEALLQAASFAAFTPTAYDGKLVLFGILNCSGDTCQLVLEP